MADIIYQTESEHLWAVKAVSSQGSGAERYHNIAINPTRPCHLRRYHLLIDPDRSLLGYQGGVVVEAVEVR